MRVLTSVGLVSLALLLSACNSSESKNKSEKEQEYQVPVETVFVTNKDIANVYRTTAVLEARVESKVTNKVTGMIDEIFVEEGTFVEKGQVLAQIDPESYLLDLERATLDLESVKSEFKRSQPVNGRQLISAKDLEKLEFQVKVATNQEKLAAIKVRDTKVVAPISGVIAKRLVKSGNMTPNAGSEMFHLVALDTLQGVVYLPEVELSNISEGQIAKLTFPAMPTLTIPARVSLISPIIDTESGTFKVTLSVDNQQGFLKPGMFAKVALELDVHANAQIVPQKALQVTDTETSLFVVEDNRAKRMIVETGYEHNGEVEILTPLDEKLPVVVVGHQGLKADSLVRNISVETQQNAPSDNTTIANTTIDNTSSE